MEEFLWSILVRCLWRAVALQLLLWWSRGFLRVSYSCFSWTNVIQFFMSRQHQVHTWIIWGHLVQMALLVVSRRLIYNLQTTLVSTSISSHIQSFHILSLMSPIHLNILIFVTRTFFSLVFCNLTSTIIKYMGITYVKICLSLLGIFAVTDNPQRLSPF